MTGSVPLACLVFIAGLVAACGGGGAGPAARPGSAPAAPGGALTTADAVMEASLAAQGGRERIGKLKTIRQSGVFQLPETGIKGTVTIAMGLPHNSLITVEVPGSGQIREGVSGEVAWEINPMTGARVVTGAERTRKLRGAAIDGEAIWKQRFPRAELAGTVDRAGQEAYKVVLTAPDGDTETRYIAKDTLLPLGLETVEWSQLDDSPAEVELSDWRDVGGIEYPHKIARKQGSQAIEILIEKIELDPPLDPAAFALPPEIAALIEALKPGT